jgi:hypothetical protein
MTVRNTDTAPVGETASEEYIDLLFDVLRYARERDYTGWDYGDGMSSRIRQRLPFDNRWVNLAFQETIKRAPINVRPLFLVEQRRNYKGTALFTMANLTAHDLSTGGGDGTDQSRGEVDFLGEATSLADWLLQNRCRGYSGFCGGHRHELQHLRTKGVPNDPDVVSTSYAVKALLTAGRLDERYPEVARTAANFVVDDLKYREVDGGAKINYHMNHDDEIYTLNAGALGARLFVDLYGYFDDDEHLDKARKILDYLAESQFENGGWKYREPASSSHLSMDNHHNGFVVETFLRYGTVVDDERYRGTVERALEFYRNTLFESDGAPNWDERRSYPRDIHAVAQGVLTFSYAGDHEFASRILEWALTNLYAGDGRFYYRRQRFYTKRITLMRWCQAWMAYAVAEFLRTKDGASRPVDRNRSR